jgi:hypothetical protein
MIKKYKYKLNFFFKIMPHNIKKISTLILDKYMINNIEHNTIEKYFNFIKNCTSYQIINTVVFYPIGIYYYLFYNEKIGTNANEIGIRFENDGIYKKNNEIYFYVCFQISNIDYYLENIKKNDVILLDKDFLILKFYKKRNEDLSNKNNKKSFFNQSINSKFYNVTNNIGIIQTGILQGMYSNYGIDLQKMMIENNNEKNCKKDTASSRQEEIKIEIQLEPQIEYNKKICKSNTPSFDNLEDIEFTYHFIKKNFSSKELDDYVIL